MIFPSILLLLTIAQLAFSKSNIQIHPLTTVINSDHKYKGYFSDPYYVPYNNEEKIYISGTTDKYLECDNFLSPECASAHSIAFNFSRALERKMGNTKFCGVAEIHPFQSGSGHSRSWDAVVTLHVQKDKCEGIDGWSVIVHARPENQSHLDSPPISWIGDKVLVGDFSKSAPANYDGKYFRTPPGELYLVYLKRYSKHPKRVGVFAWKMDNPRTLTHDSKPIPLLLPDENLNSEDYHDGNVKFKPIETSNIAAIKNKFVMAYSVGKYNNQSYELAAAYSDTFLPAKGQQYRKVLMSNPDHLWGSRGNKEVYYLLQADQKQGWHYVRALSLTLL